MNMMKFLKEKLSESRNLNFSRLLSDLLNRNLLKKENYKIPDHLVDEFDFYVEKLERVKDEPFPELRNGLLAVIKYRFGKYRK